MHQQDDQAVLRCPQCNKPFDKQSSLKRHGYYCRSRKFGVALRSRSCVACAQSKARCDNRPLGCSRCAAKAIECHYPANKRTRPDDDTFNKRQKTSPSSGTKSSSIETLETIRHENVNNDEFLDGDHMQLGWDFSEIDFDDFLIPGANGKDVQSPSSWVSSLERPWIHQGYQVQQPFSFLDMSIQPVPTYNSRSIIRRPKLKTGAQRTADLILHTLKSYLVMMRHNELPPFIHPQLLSFDVAENNDMESFTNCMNLMHMTSGELPGSRKLFWKNVRLECERLCEKCLTLNKRQLLAAIQALSIYILIRVDEGETDDNNFDPLLIATVTTVSKQLNGSDIRLKDESALYKHDVASSWNEWVFEESARRLCVVYQVVNMLVYFEPAAMCEQPSDIILAPLPARKQLWEAGNAMTWKAESDKQPRSQTEFGLATNGDIVHLQDGNVDCWDVRKLHMSLNARTPMRGTANWEEWCSGMDGFGGLVMLAASLVA